MLVMLPHWVQAMGLRSFVALPVNKGGVVARLQYLDNIDANTGFALTSIAWGLSGKDTLLFGLPYRLSPSGGDRLGDFSLLYRRILWQDDRLNSTNRFAILAGTLLATESGGDGAVQLGFVTTFYRDRNSLDIDVLYQKGLGTRRDSGRYDISWQHRLSPVQYPDWGFATEWYSVIELNGRWREGFATDQQVTVGIQWVHHKWVLEGGLIQGINNGSDTQYLLSTRLHF